MNADAKDTFSRRLRQARMMRALSLRGLAEALKGAVSHNALAKYENGEMMPGSDVLGRLADALGQPPDFFFRPFTLQLKEIKFRKRARLGVKGAEAICEQAREYFERYHEIEELLGESRRFEGKLDIKPVKTPEDADEAADELRRKWKLGRDPLPNLVELLETKGIKVYELERDEADCDGFSAQTEIGPVIVLAPNKNLLRKRMTIAHEAAHIVVPLAGSLTEKEEESIAKRFAGAMLLPNETFVAEFGKLRNGISLAELIEMKVNFGASIWAIMMRARQLGLISEAVFLRFCKEATPWRSAKQEPGDNRYQGNESQSRFRQLVHRAVAEDQIGMSKGAALLRQSLGDFRRELQEVFA
jgi:Zn-dependent peptidase ImmA (M78 family)